MRVFLLCLLGVKAAIFGEVVVGGTQPLNGPMGLQVAPDGKLLVVDSDNHRVLRCPNWQLQDFVQQPCELLAGFGGGGFEASQLRTPYVAVPVQISGSSYGLVIADTHNHRIQYWPFGQNFGRTLVGGPGFGAPSYDGPGELEFPAGLAIDEERGFMYVADTGHHRVVRYTLDDQMQVVGTGLTVAGVDGLAGSNMSLLDNPTALALSGDRLYVADARNNRLMTWLVRPELLASVSVRRLASLENESTSSTMTTSFTLTTLTSSSTTSSSSTASSTSTKTSTTSTTTSTATSTATSTSSTATSTSSTATSTSSTATSSSRTGTSTSYTTSATRTSTTTTSTTSTYDGPRYILEMDGFTGRPYGIYVSSDGLYISDADGCMIWKKLRSGQKSVVAGGSCGGSTSQLRFPGALWVEPGGSIMVADSRNNRVLRFGSEPSAVDEKCTLGGQCQLVLRNGMPTARNRLTLAKNDGRSSCGGRCTLSGLGGGTWVPVPYPQPPLLSVMTFDFGVAGVGETLRDYLVCFGPEGHEEEIAMGNCSSMPYAAGSVRMLPRLATIASAECVTGTPCRIALDGYGIPNSLVVAAVLDGAYGSGTVCGMGSTQNFQGYRSFLLNNPGTIESIDEPYLSQNNRSATVTVFFGQAISLGSQLLCACYDGNDCTTPTRFKEEIGYMRVRSALTNSNYCRFGESCILNISGLFLRDSDAVALTPTRLASCPSLSFQDAEALGFGSAVANASTASTSLLTVENGLNFALFEMGTAMDNGIFQVCYCASYDGEDLDLASCSSPTEFTHSAGTLVIMRVDTQDYECAALRSCQVEVSGLFMADTDVLLETPSGACGSVVPQQAAVVAGVVFEANFFEAQAGATSDPNATQLFQLITFASPGVRQLCYCSSYDSDPFMLNDQVRGACNDAGEFIQPLGRLLIRGPMAATVSCAANLPCNITISGFNLAADDLLQVCPTSEGCGNTSACSAAGPEALSGLLSPLSASSSETSFGLGSLPIGSYLLCYCAPGSSGTAPISCSQPQDLDMPAGELRVRGVNGNQFFECVENLLCQFIVGGYDLRASDVILAIPLDGQCGVTESNFQLNTFNPSSRSRATANVGSGLQRQFDFDSITVPERYKLCYCVFTACVNASEFSEEVGILVVKGIQRSRYPLTCALGDRCSVSFNGSGFEVSTDQLKMIPSGVPCGGDVLRVTGDGSNGTAELLGTYEKGPFLRNERLFYLQRNGRFLVYYNIFRGWWVMHTDLDSQEPPLAWAEGRDYTTPDQLPNDAWQIWITDDITVIGGGYWYAHPTLRVDTIVDVNFAFGMNPTSVMTRIVVDDVLGLPYLTSTTFDLGLAATPGTYKLCWCPSWDWPQSQTSRGGDLDNQPCTSEQEFFVNNGNLVVGFLTTQARYHCILSSDCSAGVALPASLTNQRAVLLPGGIRCAEARWTMASPWSTARNLSGEKPLNNTNWTLFNFGSAGTSGSFELCVCTEYDNGQDGMTCSQIEEFYEHAGTLTVAAEVSLIFEAGVSAVLNVSRGAGLDASDRLFFHAGFFCNASTLGSFVASPSNVEATGGSWANYDLGPNALALPSGRYVACLCTNFDGPDSDEVPCSDASEYTAPVARLQVAAVQGPQLYSSISGSISLRLTLARRLSTTTSAAVSSGWALAQALQAALTTSLELFLSPVTVEITGLSPLVGSGFVDATANFTASFNGSANDQLLEVRGFDNASCPDSLLDPPWSSSSPTSFTPAFSDSALLLGCLRLADVLQQGAFLTALQELLQNQTVVGLANPIQVLSVGDLQVPVMGYLPALFRCVRGAPCLVPVEAAVGAGTMPSGGSMFLTGGVCGAEATQPLSQVLPSNPVDASALSSSASRLVSLGAPLLEGSYTMCYCAGSDTGSGACGSYLDYFSLVGELTIRGAYNAQAFCVVFQDCRIGLSGVGLAVWDVLLVKDGGSCYDASLADFGASIYFGVNPSGLPQQDSLQQWHFDLGTAMRTGTYKLCYCASYSANGTVPCQSPADFTMEAGQLFVRGVQEINAASYYCVRSGKGDGDAPCSLTVQGTALMPVQDKVLLIPSTMNASCGQVASEVAFGVSPNPVALSLSDANATRWGVVDASDAAIFTVERFETPGDYQVCYCADAPDGSLDGRGACFSSTAGFYHEVGSLQVRGATRGQMFLCVPGGECEVNITGVNLSAFDKVRLVGEEDSCMRAASSVQATALDSYPAIEVDDSSARFSLGTIQALSGPMALRLCYCASFNQDGEGADCSTAADFTHAAGVVNVAICPGQPAAAEFVVPVQDVYGDVGDGKFRLYALPAWLCQDTPSRTQADAARYQTMMTLGSGGAEGKGSSIHTEDMVFSSREGQCHPGLEAMVPRLPSRNISRMDVSVVAGQGASSMGLPIHTGFKLQGASNLADEGGNQHICKTWEVEVRSFGCGWDAALAFGAALHLLILLVLVWTCFSNQIYYCSAFCYWTQKVEPIVDENQVEEPLRRLAKADTTKSPGTPSVKAFAAGGAFAAAGASLDEPDRPLRMLCSARTAWTLSGLRLATLLIQLALVLARVEDIVIFFLTPILLGLVCFFMQVTLVWAASGRWRRCFKRPQHVFHSCTLNWKLHADMVIPWLAHRHHAELWRPAAVLVFLEILVQVILPVLKLLLGLWSGRWVLSQKALRPMWSKPRPTTQSLDGFQLDAGDERIQPFLQAQESSKPLSRAGLSEVAQSLSLETLPLVPVKKDLQGVTSEVDTPEKPSREARREAVEFVSGGISVEEEEEWSPSTRPHRMELYAAEGRPTRTKSFHTLAQESQQKREELVMHMFRMKALEAHLAEKKKPRRRCAFYCAAPRCLRLKQWRWQASTCGSSWEDEPPEEFRRRRIVGLWGFLDDCGLNVAALYFRRHAEGAGGFQLPHFEERRAFVSSAVGGFDLAVICIALIGMYLPRLNYTELIFLLLSAMVTILQVARPGIFQAASSMAEDLFITPLDLLCFFLAAVCLRCLGIVSVGLGCASFSWGGYLLWTCSILVFEGPVLLICWRSWPVIWSIVRGYAAPWPHLHTMFTDFAELFLPQRLKARNQRLKWKFKDHAPVLRVPDPPGVSRAPGALRKLDAEAPPPVPNLREAAYQVMEYRKEQGREPPELQWLPAEPCLAALVQLVEDIVYGVPQELSRRILDEQEEAARLHELFADLNRRPPHIGDRKRRVRRLREARDLVDRLASDCEYMGPMTRLSYDELRTRVAEELWLAESMVHLDALMRSSHFCRGCLGSRAALLEQMPSTPRLWLVHHDTLRRLGRLPKPREFQHLTLASDAYKAHGKHALLMLAVHRWRSPLAADLHNVTWRQLVTFTRWYRWRWGEENEIYFWIDSCCVPEIRGKLPEEPQVKPDLWREEEQEEVPGAAEQSSFVKWSGRRGLTNLAAWSQATGDHLDKEDYVEEKVDTEYLAVTSGRHCDLTGLDAVLPGIFASADAVVLCESHDFEKDAWCRLYLSMAYALQPSGRLIYEVKRGLVHISRRLRLERTTSEVPYLEMEGGLQLEDAAETGETGNETGPVTGAVPVQAETLCEQKDSPEFLEECLDRFMDEVEARSYEKPLPVPTDWDILLLEREEDMGRIQRFASLAMDTPTLPCDTGYKRLPLVYGQSKALICSLAGPKRGPTQRKVQMTQEDESSSESEVEAPPPQQQDSDSEIQDLPVVPYTYTQESEEEKMLELYFNRGKAAEESLPKGVSLGTTTTSWFNATSPALTRSLQPSPAKLTLSSAPTVLRFHESFVSRAVKIDVRRRVAERICETATFLRTSSVGSGGMAMLSKPLQIRDVCPDSPGSLGVSFDVVVEEVSLEKHREGLAIGFTQQAPEEWPHHRRAVPQTAYEMPRSCVLGYSGRWVAPGQRELVQGTYDPSKLKRGDVLTAVIASAPAKLMRVLVNGKVVAQKPLSFTGLDPSQPLWGLIDLEGSCVKVRLGANLLPNDG